MGGGAPADVVGCLRQGLSGLARAWAGFEPAAARAVAAPRLHAPIPRPGRILAIGRNFRDHAAETGFVPDRTPRALVKLSSSVVGPGAPIRRPPGIHKMDWEVEVAIIIGAPVSDGSLEAAVRAIAGFTVANDITARELQLDRTPPQTSFAKSLDGFTPMGPALVTRDEVDHRSLTLTSRVNGTLMQHGSTRDLIFSFPEIVAHIAPLVALEPGDVILTGTPAGSGAFRDPPIFLTPGDVVRAEVSGLGVLENPIA